MSEDQWAQLVSILVGLAITIVIPWVGYVLGQFLNQALGHIKDQRVRDHVKVLVASAEQTIATDPEKHEYVARFLRHRFPGLTYSDADNLIQAGVLALHSELGTSTHTWGGSLEDQAAVKPAPVNITALVNDLSTLVAPSLAGTVATIVTNHLAPHPAVPPLIVPDSPVPPGS